MKTKTTLLLFAVLTTTGCVKDTEFRETVESQNERISDIENSLDKLKPIISFQENPLNFEFKEITLEEDVLSAVIRCSDERIAKQHVFAMLKISLKNGEVIIKETEYYAEIDDGIGKIEVSFWFSSDEKLDLDRSNGISVSIDVVGWHLYFPATSSQDSSVFPVDVLQSAATDRLSAYRELLDDSSGGTYSDPPDPEIGKWRIREDTSPIDDSKSIFCSLDSDDSIGFGYSRNTPTLIVRYKESSLDAFINFETYLGSDNPEVTVRYGKEPASREEWSISTDNKAAFVTGDIQLFLDKLAEIEKFIVRLTPYGESPMTASFSTHGADKVRERIQEIIKEANK
jgi:type VI secretion system protein VasI